MYPPVEVSSGQEQYYIRSAWHLQSDIPSLDVPPVEASYGQVELTWVWLTWAQMYAPVEASSGQDWY